MTISKKTSAIAAVLLAAAATVAVAYHVHAGFKGKHLDLGAPASIKNLAGLWVSYPTAGGDAVESFSMYQSPPNRDGGATVMTFGSISSVNEFSYTGNTISGVVTGEVTDDGSKITWSHGYTSKLQTKATDLNGLWDVYKLPDKSDKSDKKACGKPELQDLCSVVQFGSKISSYCKNGLFEYSLNIKEGTLTGSDENVGAVVGTDAVYFAGSGIMAIRAPPLGAPKGHYGGKTRMPAASMACLVGTLLLAICAIRFVCRACAEKAPTPPQPQPVTVPDKVKSPLVVAQGYPGLV
jgi:hypothetical protein